MNKVIIIGDDNVNTLGVIWNFSKKNIKVYLLIMGINHKLSVIKSRYVEKYWVCENTSSLIKQLHAIFEGENDKPVLIPTTDSSALIIDNNYDSLKEKYILPSINNVKGNIEMYMNKYNQFKLACNNNVKMAKTKVLDLRKKESITFPCILKPIVSAKGKKEDIRICNNSIEFEEAKKELLELNYTKILYQQFLTYCYEIDVSGFSYNGDVSIPGYIKKERIWPSGRGSTTFGIVKNIHGLDNIIDGIKNIMKQINYNGIFDIDIFVVKKDKENIFYLNEINFRNGAIAYSYGESLISYYWYLSNINNKMFFSPSIKKDYYVINEQADLHNLFERKISLFRYLGDLRKSKIKMNFNIRDIKPCIYACLYKFFR